MERLTRGELLSRSGRVALAAGAVGAFPARSRELASAAPPDPHLRRARPRSIHGTVVAPGSAAYDQARLLESTRFDTFHPHAIVYCTSALGRRERPVRWARRPGIHVVPRSGGHSYARYFVDEGVVIDVCGLTPVVSARQARRVVGAGARLIDVYARSPRTA